MWSALCSWQNNLRITINYLARLTCACGNMGAMIQQAKRIMVSFSRGHASAIVAELIRDLQVLCLCVRRCGVDVFSTLQSVEIISADLQPSELPPFYCLAAGDQTHSRGASERGEGREQEEGWTLKWRTAVRGREAGPVALPTPPSKQHFASLKSLLKLPVRQLVPLHRYY